MVIPGGILESGVLYYTLIFFFTFSHIHIFTYIIHGMIYFCMQNNTHAHIVHTHLVSWLVG
jgi:hypothetical protein